MRRGSGNNDQEPGSADTEESGSKDSESEPDHATPRRPPITSVRFLRDIAVAISVEEAIGAILLNGVLDGMGLASKIVCDLVRFPVVVAGEAGDGRTSKRLAGRPYRSVSGLGLNLISTDGHDPASRR